MGATVPKHPTRAQPHEGGYKRSSPSLHGCSGIANGIPVHSRGTTLPSPDEIQDAADEAFDGTKDPVDHLNTYKTQMELHGYQDPVRCRAFAIMQKGSAFAWFNRLPPASISSFRELSIAFVPHFIGARTYRKSSFHLLTVKQGPQQNLRSYIQRFNSKSLKIDIPYEKFAITTFITGLGIQSKDLMFSISKNPQASMAEVLAKAKKYINGKEALISKRGSSSAQKEKRKDEKERDRSPKRPRQISTEEQRRQRSVSKEKRYHQGPLGSTPAQAATAVPTSAVHPPPPPPPPPPAPLPASVSQVLYEVHHEKFLRWPSQMKTDAAKRDITKYASSTEIMGIQQMIVFS